MDELTHPHKLKRITEIKKALKKQKMCNVKIKFYATVILIIVMILKLFINLQLPQKQISQTLTAHNIDDTA